MNMNPNGLLKGIRAVELATFVAGPSLGRMLTHYGAEVIKVENPAGDYWRTFGTKYNMPAEEEENPLFDQYNGCKKSLILDLKKEQGKEVLLKLLETADIFIVNVRTRALERLGLDYETLKERFPRLIYAHITGYGDVGPDKDLPAYDTTAFWAATGFINDLSLDGLPERYPVDTPASVGDTTTGAMLYGAVATALYAREKTGRGDRVTVSLFGTALWVMSHLTVSSQAKYGRVYPRTHRTCTPPPFHCADGEWIVLSLLTNWERDYPVFCRVMGREDLVEDPRFACVDDYLLSENSEAFADIFDPVFPAHPSAYWKKLFDDNKLVCAIVGHFSTDTESEQAHANGFIRSHVMPNGETCWITVPSPQSANMGTSDFWRGPLLGEHSSEIMEELGYSQEEIRKMAEEQITYLNPRKGI